MNNFVETTDGITITATPMYVDGQSDMLQHRFVFAYFIRIENRTNDTVQLLRRHWFIRDGNGGTKEVEGEGVVGKQPVLSPGTSHEYNSFCILETFEGSMDGTYLMRRSNGEEFLVSIPRFTLTAAAN